MKKLGLIVNPLAGVGGAVGLKGSDGPEIQRLALERGAVPKAGVKTALALDQIRSLAGEIEVFAGPGAMGADAARELGFKVQVVAGTGGDAEGSRAEDTEAIARQLAALPVDILLFAGGDGTARNICASVPSGLPVIGIPAGVKIHSAVYATSPLAAGKAAYAALSGAIQTHDAEVMDIDEDEYRAGRLQARLYGYLAVPALRGVMQNPKAASHHQANDMSGICHEIADRMAADDRSDRCYIFGAGSTVNQVMHHLGLQGTLLGVDVVRGGTILARDVTEAELLRCTAECPCQLILTVIGGQGHIFGRGNQQLSPTVIRQIGLENIWIVAAAGKIYSLTDQRLFVDTGDESLNQELRGYRRVIVGYQESLVCQVL